MNGEIRDRQYAVVVAAGAGRRMGGEVPKQFALLCGVPVVMRTIAAFHSYDAAMPVVVVVPEGALAYWGELCRIHRFALPHRAVEGGATRFQSVMNGLNVLPDAGWIAIHDGVRPLIKPDIIAACMLCAKEKGNAIPVIAATDTVREIDDQGSIALDRARLRMVQTPQCFSLAEIKNAYRQKETPLFTDDASVMEQAGYTVHLTEGDAENIKITRPLDMKIAEMLINKGIAK